MPVQACPNPVNQCLPCLEEPIVNLSAEAVDPKLAIEGFTPRSGEAYELTSRDPASMKDPESFSEHTTSINGVVLPDIEVDDPSAFGDAIGSIRPKPVPVDGDLGYHLPPYSAAAITLTGEFR